jgi:hypothetical protein
MTVSSTPISKKSKKTKKTKKTNKLVWPGTGQMGVPSRRFMAR